MIQLKISKVFSTELDAEFENPKVLEISDEKVHKGNFGELYSCNRIDGKKLSSPQLIKILTVEAEKNFATIIELQKRIKDASKSLRENGDDILELYPALRAIPQFSFHAVLNGKKVMGYSATDLNQQGFVQFKEIGENEDLAEEFYYNSKFLDRFRILFQLIKTMQFLWTMKYIHADFKTDALFINLENKSCAIIDYDSGALVNARGLAADATTIGTMQDWLAPELIKQTGHIKQTTKDPDIYSDQWSIAMCAFDMLFRLTPYAFMKNMSDATMKAYFDDHKWPTVNASKPYVDEDNYALAEYIENIFEDELPSQMRSVFETTFNEGYFNPEKRPSYEEWLNCFKELSDPVKIEHFEPSPAHLEVKGSVTFSWKIQNGKRIYLDDQNVSALNQYLVHPRKASTYTLVAYGEFDTKDTTTTRVTVSGSEPSISNFYPHQKIRLNHDPIRLIWSIDEAEKVILNPGKIDVTGKTSYSVEPLRETKYSLTAESYFGVPSTAYCTVMVSDVQPNVTVSARPKKRKDNEPVSLSWKTEGAETVKLLPSGEDLALEGSIQIAPIDDTKYTIEATSLFGVVGSASCHVKVKKSPPRFLALRCFPSIIRSGAPVRIKWMVELAEKMWINGLEVDPAAGSWTEFPDESGSIEITAESPYGAKVERKLKIHVLKSPRLRSYVVNRMLK